MKDFNYYQKINEVGKNCGILLSYIPFYYFIKQVSILNEMDNMAISPNIKSKVKVNSIVTICLLVFIIIMIIATFGFGIFMISNINDYFYDNLSNLGSSNLSSDLLKFIFLALINFIAIIALYICAIVTGVSVDKYLNTNESLSLSENQRYNIAKYVGASLSFIPFYMIIKLISSYTLIKETVSQFKWLYIVIYVMLFISYLSQFTMSVLPLFVSLSYETALSVFVFTFIMSSVSLFLPIIAIIGGVMMSKLFDEAY